jgi:murein DD-endopeptidase MepM/ murein hydrolase activator NlpD
VNRPVVAAFGVATLLATPVAYAQLTGPGSGLARDTAARQPFAVPLRGPLESRFGYRWGRLHAGLDIAVLKSDRVHAALAGTVAKVGYRPSYAGYGNVVLIRHGNGLATLYAHLARFRVRVGEWVARGELIGRAGCTGSCTGAHLHFEVRELGRPVNPMRYLRRLDGSAGARSDETNRSRARSPGRDGLRALPRLG